MGQNSYNFETLINKTGVVLIETLKRLSYFKPWKAVRKFWINNSAFPDMLPSKDNDFVRDPVNALVSTGFQEIDTFLISLPREEQYVCMSHYACRLHNTTNQSTVRGRYSRPKKWVFRGKLN